MRPLVILKSLKTYRSCGILSCVMYFANVGGHGSPQHPFFIALTFAHLVFVFLLAFPSLHRNLSNSLLGVSPGFLTLGIYCVFYILLAFFPQYKF